MYHNAWCEDMFVVRTFSATLEIQNVVDNPDTLCHFSQYVCGKPEDLENKRCWSCAVKDLAWLEPCVDQCDTRLAAEQRAKAINVDVVYIKAYSKLTRLSSSN